MKPFNREKAKAGEPLVTRDGTEVLAYFDSGLDVDFPILAFVRGGKAVSTYTAYGLFYSRPVNHHLDLFMKSQKREYWTNLFRLENGNIATSSILHESQEKAIAGRSKTLQYLGEPVLLHTEEI